MKTARKIRIQTSEKPPGMRRTVIPFLCMGAGLLCGCLHTATAPQSETRTLTPVYTDNLPSTIDFLEYAGNGQTFIAAGGYRFIYLYDARTFEKHFALNSGGEPGTPEMFDNVLATRGAGYIDDNIWYFATGNRNVEAVIRQITPPRELYRHDLGRGSSRPVIINKNHLAYLDTLLDWHDGTVYKAIQAHPGSFGYTMSANSQIMTFNAFSGHALLHDPVRQKSVVWKNGFRTSRMALSGDGRYAAALSGQGKCVLWRLPEKEQLGSCGHGVFSDSRHTEMVFQRDSRALAVSVDEVVRVYATEPFKLLMKVTMAKPVTGLALSEDRLAIADESLAITVWNTADGTLLGRYVSPEPKAIIHKLAFQPGGTELAASVTGQHLSQLMILDMGTSPSKAVATTP